MQEKQTHLLKKIIACVTFFFGDYIEKIIYLLKKIIFDNLYIELDW